MGVNILLVEDSEHVRASLIGLIECIPSIGSIRAVNTLIEAWQYVLASLPSMVILDMHLPDGLGSELIKPIKHVAPEVRIAVFTNDVNDYYKSYCIACGADWFFDKSTEFHELLAVVRAVAETQESMTNR